MSSRSPDRRGARVAGFLLVAVSAAALAVVPGSGRSPLRVCADPDNLPFSRQDQSGFENRIAALVARALDADVRYYWWPQRRGFVRNTLDANVCDVIVGIPAGSPGVLTTAPYYRAGYVFAYRPERVHALRSFDDPRLARLRVGVPLIGNDMAASPPGAALARRGMVDNVIGYPPLGSTTVSERMLGALEDGTLDVALLWAPQAAYFAARMPFPVTLAPAFDPQGAAPPAFAMAMAVRKDDTALRDALDVALKRAHPDIDAVLAEYGVTTGDATRVAPTPPTPGTAQ